MKKYIPSQTYKNDALARIEKYLQGVGASLKQYTDFIVATTKLTMDDKRYHSYRKSINKLECAITEPLFSDVTLFQDILSLYSLFIQGLLPTSPNHHGPLCEESKELIDRLLAMNQHGILTVGSQPGLLGQEKIQRAYVDFFVPKDSDILSVLIGGLRNSKDVLCQIYSDDQIINDIKTKTKNYPMTTLPPDEDLLLDHKPENNELVGNKGCYPFLPLSVRNEKEGWIVYTVIQIDLDYEANKHSWDIIVEAAKDAELPDVVGFHVVHKEFGKNDLLDIILNILKKS